MEEKHILAGATERYKNCLVDSTYHMHTSATPYSLHPQAPRSAYLAGLTSPLECFSASSICSAVFPLSTTSFLAAKFFKELLKPKSDAIFKTAASIASSDVTVFTTLPFFTLERSAH